MEDRRARGSRRESVGHFIERRRIIMAAGGGALALSLGAFGEDKEEGATTANEDLMREHGIIRRALFVYAQASHRARIAPDTLPLPQLLETARLFRAFAEDYHERELEEQHIFPVVRRIDSQAAQFVDVLRAQHQRGRDITDYIVRVAKRGRLAPADAQPLASALDGMVAMYGPHAAREDTDLFPVWKKAIGARAYIEMGEKFEEIERRTFGHDGFDDAHTRIARIEVSFALVNLAEVTAPPPPPA
jgi:hemerythrin-like domain-containing protein